MRVANTQSFQGKIYDYERQRFQQIDRMNPQKLLNAQNIGQNVEYVWGGIVIKSNIELKCRLELSK